MVDKLINIINKLQIPKVILRYIMMNFLDLSTINNLLLTIKKMNVLDDYSRDLLIKANKGFIWNCEHGHLSVAKWLYLFDRANIHDDYENAFAWACGFGHLAVARWLYGLATFSPSNDNINNNINIDIHSDNEHAFRWSCINGHLTVAKWLYSISNSQINIHANNEDAFTWSCINGHLTVAKWLYKLAKKYSLGNINIYAYEYACKENAFTLSCQHGHLDVAKWLYSIDHH